MAKRKWNWKYRFYIGRLYPLQLTALTRFCSAKFGSIDDLVDDRWDYSAPLRKSPYAEHHNVQLFFRTQEDFVMFKLLYNPEAIYG